MESPIRIERREGLNLQENYNKYIIFNRNTNEVLTTIVFQDGAVREFGINGCQLNEVIQVCVDQLLQFQRGEFKCEENDIALSHLEKALIILEKRTKARIAKGVEGTNNL